MKLHVEVTAEDIAKGTRHGTESCPIAMALRRCRGVSAAYVDDGVICVDTDDEQRLESGTPLGASDFVRRFDAGKPVQPLTFDIEVGPGTDDDEYPDDDDDEGSVSP